MILSLVLSLLTQFAPAHADPTTLASFVGNYEVKDCTFTENYMPNPKDYYCRASTLNVVALENNTFEITFVDELDKSQIDVAMNEFRLDQKDGTVVTGVFSNSDNSSAWTETSQTTQGVSTGQSRTFTFDPATKTVTLARVINGSSSDSYKVAEWDYTLVKK